MKKIVIWIFLVLFVFMQIPTISYAGWEQNSDKPKDMTVVTTEKVPWWKCKEIEWGYYECKVARGFGAVQNIIWDIIAYGIALAALAGVLYIVINGILLSTWAEPWEVKKRIIWAVIWLLLVLMMWTILSILFPWIYK